MDTVPLPYLEQIDAHVDEHLQKGDVVDVGREGARVRRREKGSVQRVRIRSVISGNDNDFLAMPKV